MASTRSDQYILSTDTTFQNRVRASMIAACIAIYNEGWSVVFHRERQTLAVQIVNSPDTYKLLLANGVATDASCISDATVAGTVVLTSGNVAAQAALVTDAHIDAAVSGQFNCFVKAPSA